MADIGAARRRAVSAIIAEDLEAFAHARRAAQRGLVHALDKSITVADIRRCHSKFTLEASRDYAAQAARFDAMVEELLQSAAPDA